MFSLLKSVINIIILHVYTRSVRVEAIKSTEHLDWTQEIFPGALSAVLGKLVSSMLFTMHRTTSSCEPKLWWRMLLSPLMLHHSDSGMRVIMYCHWVAKGALNWWMFKYYLDLNLWNVYLWYMYDIKWNTIVSLDGSRGGGAE